jgi:peptide/nickel transport system substrate-binding protein
MQRRSHWLVFGLILAAVSLLVVGPAGAASKATPKPASGGTVVFGAEQEPSILNPDLIGGDAFWGLQIISPVLPAAYRLYPDFTIRPEAVSSAAVTSKNPFTVTFNIKKNAKWMDGTPISGNDFLFTAQTMTNPANKVLSTDGWDLIDLAKSKVSNGGKTVKVVFTKPFEPWKLLFTTGGILPKKDLEGADFNKVFQNDFNSPKTGKPISGGPFYMPSGGWVHGQQATLLANPKFWGPKPHLSRLVYRFLPDTNTTVEEIKGGTVDVIYPAPDVFLVPLRSSKTISQQIGQGPIYEHLDFNMGYKDKGNPLLKNLWVRQAIAYGIDRDGLNKALFVSTGIAPKLKTLNSVVITSNSPYYKPVFAKWKHNSTKAEALLKSHGCTKGGDGIYSCGGQRASFRFGYRAGIALRQRTFEIFQAQLKDIGIEITPDATPQFNSTNVPAGDYDLAIYAWVGTPDIVSGTSNIYECRNDTSNLGQQNTTGWCNAAATKALEQASNTFDLKVQASLVNKAIAQMANDLNTIPLYQRPTALVYRNQVHGLKENPTNEGPVWNVGTWFKTKV